MKNKIAASTIIIIGILIMASCKVSEIYVKEIPDPYFERDFLSFQIEVPYKNTVYVITGGEMEVEYQFRYSDNSLIYVSNDAVTGGGNYDNIKTLNDSIYKIRFPNNRYQALLDTIELSGTLDSLYWKDIKLNRFSIGYRGVSEKRKDIYEKALQTFKILPLQATP